MTNKECLEEFDVFYNSITSFQAPGLNEYEKSVFLNQAQEDILTSYISAEKNKVQKGYDDNTRRQISFSNLIQNETHSNADFKVKDQFDTDVNGRTVKLGDDVFSIIYDTVTTDKGVYQVIPVKHSELIRLMSRPYRFPLKRQAWRVTADSENAYRIIIGNGQELKSYNVTYIKKPTPIDLEGESDAQFSELDTIIHRDILKRAVELAKAAYLGDINTQLALGNASQTDLGIIPPNKE